MVFLKMDRGNGVGFCMGPRFVNIDHDTPLLLPPNLRDWVPSDHLSHFILDAVDELDLRQVRVNTRGTGSEQYPPSMLLSLLLYSYATGVFSSRRIEQSTYESVPARLIAGDSHPDHDTLCAFRCNNLALINESFVRVLEMAAELKVLKVGQITVAIDGTKVMANASKHSAVSYQRSGELIQQLELEVKELMEKAEKADSTPLEEGLSIPAEIARRQERKAQLAKARAEIEARAHARDALAKAEYEKKVAHRKAQEEAGKTPKGRDPKEPVTGPKPTDQYNFTDPESRIMKAGNGDHYEQAYNAQAAVEVESRLIVAQRVTDAPNDKEQLVPTVEAIVHAAGSVESVLADSGYYSEKAVETVESRAEAGGTQVYAAVEKTGHHRSVEDLERKEDPKEPEADASTTERMRHRMKTQQGREKYKLRQQTVEPVFGIIKSVLGFRRFMLRGLGKVKLEWALVSTAYNLKRLHRMMGTG